MSDYENEQNHPDSEDQQSSAENPQRRFVPSRPGRMVTTRGLVERVVEEFMIEHGEGESDAVREATTSVERRGMVRDVAQYVFGIESVDLTIQEQAQIIAQAYSEIFGYGALDPLFVDEDIVTITMEGIQRIAVRYGPGEELIPLDPVFDFAPEMRSVLRRLFRHAGAEVRPDIAIMEAGLVIEGRRVCVTAAFPPYVSEIAADIRIHPRITPSLDDLVRTGFMTDHAKGLVDAIARSPYGFVIVGDTESGKTTLLGSLLTRIDSPQIVTVERAGELHLPDTARRFTPKWAQEPADDLTFGEQILAALASHPQLLVLDEVRADEPETITPLLRESDVPRMIWSFRGSSEPTRIRSSLNMLARMADSSQPEAMVYQLYQRLPYILIVKRRKGSLYLREIAEWQFPADASSGDGLRYADYVPLMTMQSDQLVNTGNKPIRQLDLPEDFWN